MLPFPFPFAYVLERGEIFKKVVTGEKSALLKPSYVIANQLTCYVIQSTHLNGGTQIQWLPMAVFSVFPRAQSENLLLLWTSIYHHMLADSSRRTNII